MFIRGRNLKRTWIPVHFLPLYKIDSFEDLPSDQQGTVVNRFGTHDNYMRSAVWLEPEFLNDPPDLMHNKDTQTTPPSTPIPTILKNFVTGVNERVSGTMTN